MVKSTEWLSHVLRIVDPVAIFVQEPNYIWPHMYGVQDLSYFHILDSFELLEEWGEYETMVLSVWQI